MLHNCRFLIHTILLVAVLHEGIVTEALQPGADSIVFIGVCVDSGHSSTLICIVPLSEGHGVHQLL